jgi:hypothetical protein
MAGTDLEITVNSANADSSTSFSKCTSALTTYAANYSRGTQGVDYTRTGTGYPVKIALNFTPGTLDITHNGFEFGANCTGDGNPTTIDFFLCIQGNGRDTGFGNDAVKVGSTAHDVQVVSDQAVCGANIQGRTGGLNCGPKENNGLPNAAHQDMIQFQGATNIQWFDSYGGDWAHYQATCAGSGGADWINAVAPTSYCLGNPGCEWLRGHAITCNHGLNAKITSQTGVVNPGNSHGVVANSFFRIGAAADIAALLCAAPGSSNNLATEAPGWTFTANTSETYCASGAPSYCVNNGGPGFNPANN